MAAARLIHFGSDDGARVPMLQRVGYEVRQMNSLDRLRQDLGGDDEVDAVIVAGVNPHRAEKAADLTRQFSGAPLVLFHPPGVALDVSRFDRVFSPSTPEKHWLFDIAVLVMQGKELREASDLLRQDSQALYGEVRPALGGEGPASAATDLQA